MHIASGIALVMIGIVPFIMNIEEDRFRYNFIICTKLKQPLIIRIDFAQRYKIGVEWHNYGSLTL